MMTCQEMKSPKFRLFSEKVFFSISIERVQIAGLCMGRNERPGLSEDGVHVRGNERYSEMPRTGNPPQLY